VTLTWLIHDVGVWRIDRVFLGAEGGPWISTQTDTDGTHQIADPPIWHRSADGKELTALLNRLGVGLTGVRPSPETHPAASEPAASEAVSASDEVAASPRASASSAREGERTSSTWAEPSRWVWAATGALLGAALTLAAGRRRGGTAGEPGLTSARTPDPDSGIDAVPERPGSETLSSHSPGKP
jgi:hypothetical protein